MRTRPTALAALTATFALLLGACTSGDDAPQETGAVTPDGATEGADQEEETGSDAAGSTAPPADRGYLCRYVTEATQRSVAGQDLADPYQLIVENDADSWVCEARDGEEGLVRVSILRGEGVWDTQRDLAQAQSGVSDAAPWLGESYQSSRRVTGLTMCATPGAPDYEPYALVVEAVSDSDADVSTDLSTTASAMARSMDQAVGCSPRMARGEIPGPTP